MGLKIADLLKWRTSVTLKDADGNDIIDPDTKEPVTVWLRIIGDEDIQLAYKKARLASAKRRKELATKDSEDFITAVEPIQTGTREEVIEVIKAARLGNLSSEAQANVVRPDEPTIEEFAVDADAPTLEEQEKYDAAVLKVEEDYLKELGEYQLVRITELENSLKDKSLEVLRVEAEDDVINILSSASYIQELLDQKLWRAVYTDKACRERAFEDMEEYQSTDSVIKDQLMAAYLKLEQNPEDIKN